MTELFKEKTETQNKLRSDDRILVLKGVEGENIKSSTGMVDNRLLKGGNRLHCIMDPQTTLWSFKLDAGGLPEPLKQQYTSFRLALEHAERYYAARNIKIDRVED